MPEYYLTYRDHCWWICENPADPEGPIGPYDTKKEAEEDMIGMRRFHRNEHRRGFVTSQKPLTATP